MEMTNSKNKYIYIDQNEYSKRKHFPLRIAQFAQTADGPSRK